MSDFSKILVTTDFSDLSLPGVEKAAALATLLDCEVALLYVVEDRLPPVILFSSEIDRHAILEGHRQKAAEKLEEYATAHMAGCRVQTAAVVGVAAKEIVRYAETNGVDLIVMASLGYGPVRQLLLGSTTERVLHHAERPVLVVPSKQG